MHKVRIVRRFSYHSSHRNAPRKNLSPNRVKLHGTRREPQPIEPVPHVSLLYLISEARTPTSNGDVVRIELVHLGTANRNPSNVQFNFNFSSDYASIPRTVPPSRSMVDGSTQGEGSCSPFVPSTFPHVSSAEAP